MARWRRRSTTATGARSTCTGWMRLPAVDRATWTDHRPVGRRPRRGAEDEAWVRARGLGWMDTWRRAGRSTGLRGAAPGACADGPAARDAGDDGAGRPPLRHSG